MWRASKQFPWGRASVAAVIVLCLLIAPADQGYQGDGPHRLPQPAADARSPTQDRETLPLPSGGATAPGPSETTTAVPTALSAPAAGSAPNQAWATLKVVADTEKAASVRIAQDLATLVADDADMELQVVPTKGPDEDIRRLRDESDVKFAIIDYDAVQALRDRANGGNDTARELVLPLRAIMPLYTEEIYFIVRADSPLTYIHEIRDRRINVGVERSDSALTSAALYRLMFASPMLEANVSHLSNEEALLKLAVDGTIDVVVAVGQQPAKLLANMRPEARHYVKLLKLDRNDPASRRALKSYFPATIRSATYAGWLREDVPTLSSMSFLVTWDYTDEQSARFLHKFAHSLCHNLQRLKREGHAKWHDVQLGLELGTGWLYSPYTEQEFTTCRTSSQSKESRTTAAVKVSVGQTGSVQATRP
jgi:TRAP-type uncharacterized transport system substrate-binding protein